MFPGTYGLKKDDGIYRKVRRLFLMIQDLWSIVINWVCLQHYKTLLLNLLNNNLDCGDQVQSQEIADCSLLTVDGMKEKSSEFENGSRLQHNKWKLSKEQKDEVVISLNLTW